MQRRTKIIISVAIAIIIIALAIFLYFYFTKSVTPQPQKGEFPSTPDTGAIIEDKKPTVLGDAGKGPRLVKLANGPVAGAISGKKGEDLVVRYIDSATGNAHEVSVSTLNKKRLTITTIPKIEEALWNKAGSSVVIRYLKEDGETIESFAGAIKPGATGEEGELTGIFLPSRVESLSSSLSGKEFVYIKKERDHSSVVVTNWSGSPKTEVWRSPILEWLPVWFSDTTIALFSKPSALADGTLLFLNRATGETKTIIKAVPGLTALPSITGKKILISQNSNGELITKIVLPATGLSIPVSPQTLPEKCVWTKDETKIFCGAPKDFPQGLYPDSWYQGIVSFSDDFWSFDAESGVARLLETPKELLDVTLPQLNADESHLIFINKKDGSLWSLRLAD